MGMLSNATVSNLFLVQEIRSLVTPVTGALVV
ncbi:LOW QUALITY PROTEIN: hypothetical protein PanWU01x14_258920 [Parasponia andersonii]|uniref:Uncharacterized protein n=1 Tax=Parasponia andersonii TaxID=3476 RepID=A0A2P5B9S1_PARAD|nr:LOW QUALITY PROTEIN: hypothetical protein PanWU01x14_258920 [Parasponia andersonii]